MNRFLRYGEYAAFYLVAGLLLWAPYKLLYIFRPEISLIFNDIGFIKFSLLLFFYTLIISIILSFLALIISTLNQLQAKGRSYLLPLIATVAVIYIVSLGEYFVMSGDNAQKMPPYLLFVSVISSLLYVTYRTYKFLGFHDNYVDASFWRVVKKNE